MPMSDRPHVIEVHTLQCARSVMTSAEPEIEMLTKYPVSKVSGRKMIVTNVNLRITSLILFEDIYGYSFDFHT